MTKASLLSKRINDANDADATSVSVVSLTDVHIKVKNEV
jgi:hypothetical protein